MVSHIKNLALTSVSTLMLFSIQTIKAEKLNLGMVRGSTSKMIKRFGPFLQYLNTKGIPAGKVVVTKDLPKMVKKFEKNKVHFMFESPMGALEMMDKAKAYPLLIREKKGVKEYNSVIFVKKNSSISSLKDLVGKVVAFEDPTSTSSFFLPKGILRRAGLEIIESKKPVPGKVAYYFSKADDNTLAQVKVGKKADAGGIKATKVLENSNFKVLQPASPFVPRHVLLISKDVSMEMREKIKKVLLEMKNDPSTKSILKTMKNPTGFSEFEGDPVKIMTTDVRKAIN